MRAFLPFLAAAVLAATPVLAAPPRAVMDGAVVQDGAAVGVHVVLLNGESDAAPAPDRLAATVAVAGRATPLVLLRDGATAVVPGHGWVDLRYRAVLPAGANGASLALAETQPVEALASAAPVTPPSVPPGNDIRPALAPQPGFAAAAAPAVARDNPLLANLGAYQPIYAVFGTSHRTGGRVQVSLQYQFFGDARAPTGDWKEGIRFGYTQRMLWDVREQSAPFHDISYMPELFYAVTGATTATGIRFSGQAGIRHESNGKGGDDSRGYQTVYLQPTATVPLGRWTLEVSPRFYQYVFGRDRNPDIGHYWGHQSLAVAIGEPDGLKLSAIGRINFGTGRGAVEAELSYPLLRVLGVPVYAVAEAFDGTGETLLDYYRHDMRARIGLGLVR